MASLKPLLSLIIIIAFLCIQLTNGQDAINSVKGGYWSQDSSLPPSHINSTLFTHLFCAFANVNMTTYQVTIPPECALFPQIVRQMNPSVKTMLSIGPGPEPSSVFDQMASQPASRRAFIDSSIRLARASSYDGLNLDWENLTQPSQMTNMTTLLNEWRVALDNEAVSSGADRLILTAAVAVNPQRNAQTRLPTQTIAKNMDWVNIMAYDIYSPNWIAGTRPPAPLFDPTGRTSGSSGIQAWIDGGVPPSQLVLGFPFYGYAWKLANPAEHGLFAPTSGIDTTVGDPTDDLVTYSQIMTFIRNEGATVVYNSTYGTNYCYSGTTWVGYDDVQSIAAKVSYAKGKGLVGYAAWEISQDDQWALSTRASEAWGPT